MSFLKQKIRQISDFINNTPPHSEHPVMQTYLASQRLDKNALISSSNLLVADLEMTGLQASSEQIVSIAWIEIQNLQIIHSTARHIYINDLAVDLGASAPIHKISHQQLATGIDQESAINAFLEALVAKVLVLHHAPIDMSFLDVICKRLYGAKLKPPIIDTMEVERRRLSLKGTLETSSIRLNDCRARYKLPQYQVHNAAVDALATAELLLAQIAHDSQSEKANLAAYMR